MNVCQIKAKVDCNASAALSSLDRISDQNEETREYGTITLLD